MGSQASQVSHQGAGLDDRLVGKMFFPDVVNCHVQMLPAETLGLIVCLGRPERECATCMFSLGEFMEFQQECIFIRVKVLFLFKACFLYWMPI